MARLHHSVFLIFCLLCTGPFLLPISAQVDEATGFNLDFETLPARHEDEPGFVYHPSAEDWRDINMYQVLTDRFYDGDPENNDDNPEGIPDLENPVGIHGGDFEGLGQKLDFLQQLGIKGIWIAPVFTNNRGEYHGYAARDFNAIDPHWGDLGDLRDFIDSAHERGIYVFIDIVTNHKGDLVYAGGEFKRDGYDLRWHSDTNRHAPPFDVDEEHLSEFFHNHGSIQDWMDLDDDGQAVVGDFMGLDDLRTSNPLVRKALIKSYKALIAATDCDGFRIDTVKHVELDFWAPFNEEILRYAAEELGKTNLLIFGEALSYEDEVVSLYTRNGFNSMLDFPTRGVLHGMFANGDSAYRLKERAKGLEQGYTEASKYQLVTFLDNHDELPRVQRQFGGRPDAVAASLTLLHTWLQIPGIYYATEQGFDGGRDPWNRENQFDGEHEYGPSLGDNFDYTHPIFRHIRTLNQLRDRLPSLRRGTLTHLWPLEKEEKGQGGLYVFTREVEGETVLVAVNASKSERKSKIKQDGVLTGINLPYPPGTVLVNLLGRGESMKVGVDSTNAVLSLSGYEQQLWIPEDLVPTLEPSVVKTVPRHDAGRIKRNPKISVIFDQDVDAFMETVEVSLIADGSQEPVKVNLHWHKPSKKLTMVPSSLLESKQLYYLRIKGPFAAAFESRFTTR